MTELPVAVRVYPDSREALLRRSRLVLRPEAMLVFDCETRTDEAQALTFGSYRFIVKGGCLEEGLFYADDVSVLERAALERYALMHRADVASTRKAEPTLALLTLEQFLKKLYLAAYKGRCLLVAFNFPFDISRVACGWGESRGRFAGGFSFVLWQYTRNDKRSRRAHPYRIRVAIKHIDSKRALKAFTGGMEPEPDDKIPEGSATGKPDERYSFRGHILDLRTLCLVLTDRGHSLESACRAFGVEHAKVKAQQHGVITDDYIDYNRLDVLASVELAEKLLAEYELHPVELQVTRAYSSASVGKAYLRAMGITPLLDRFPDFPKRVLGYAQSAFYGGRASAHIRKVPVPVVYTDFLSQYSTVNGLMGLWRFVIAREIRVTEDRTRELRELLADVTPEWCLQPENWKRLTGYARIIPDGDILPLRANYGSTSWQIGVNYAYAGSDGPNDGLWYTWPDLVASVLLTGKVPRIVEAFRIDPIGIVGGLKPTSLRGQVRIDPRRQDFFRATIEERKRLAKRGDLDATERARLDKALKTFGSATSYGIFAEMQRKESDDKVRLTCYGIDSGPYECSVTHPESPGEYCFSPLASLITGAGHLLLALLERLVTDRGGTYAMEDTDSMAIVATQRGGLVPCPGGPYRMNDGLEAVRALSWEEVNTIVDQFAHLNPYDPRAVSGSILKVEDDNFGSEAREQRQLWCYAISAKRYALFLREPNGEPTLLRKGANNGDDRWSEHGLGHLLNPTDPQSDDREWIAAAWLQLVRKALGLPTTDLSFQNLPAVSRTAVTSPWVMRAFERMNHGKPYAKQVKPFNFLLSAHVQPLGHPVGADPERFHLVAPFELNPKKWLTQPWIDVYSGKRCRVTTSQVRGPKVAGLMTYGDVLREYEHHEEIKCAGPDGKPCGKQTIGLLSRRHVRIAAIHFIGKESNLLEEVEAGQIHGPQSVYTAYPNAQREREAWLRDIVPKLKAIPLRELQSLTGLSRATLQAVRRGRYPGAANRAKLLRALNR